MAKSLRSKWKRKMRAVKRERYGEKELKRLNEMLAAAGDIQFLPEIKKEKTDDEDENSTMAVDQDQVQLAADLSTVHTIATKKSAPVPVATAPLRSRLDRSVKLQRKPKMYPSDSQAVDQIKLAEEDAEGDVEEEPMAIDGTKPARVFNKHTMRDQFGNYPDWMNKRKIRTQQNKNKRRLKRVQNREDRKNKGTGKKSIKSRK